MKITRDFVENTLKETIVEYKEKVYDFKTDACIEFMHKDDFIEGMKKNHIIKMLLDYKMIKNLEDYPSFLVVYPAKNNPFLVYLCGGFTITMQFEMAQKHFYGFNEEEVKIFLRHCFAHELTHLLQDKLEVEYKEIWEKSVKEAKDYELAREYFAECIADKVESDSRFKEVENELFKDVKLLMNRYKNRN